MVNFEHTPLINLTILFATLSQLKRGQVFQPYLCIKKTINSSKNNIFMKYFEFTKELSTRKNMYTFATYKKYLSH